MSDPDNAPVVVAESLSKQFDTVLAVDGISFTLPQGSVTALLGGNGAGKTSTLSMILGLLTPSSGQLRVFGVDMASNDRYQALARCNFSSPYVDMPYRLSVRQNLTVYGHLYGVSDLKYRIESIGEDLEITKFMERPTGQLSAGQKTRVALAKALLNGPELLVLDEPTASLDPDTGDRIRGYLERYAETNGAAILLASHNMAEVERLCDNVLVMRQGRIVDRGAPAELIERHGRRDLEQVFLHIARTADIANLVQPAPDSPDCHGCHD